MLSSVVEVCVGGTFVKLLVVVVVFVVVGFRRGWTSLPSECEQESLKLVQSLRGRNALCARLWSGMAAYDEARIEFTNKLPSAVKGAYTPFKTFDSTPTILSNIGFVLLLLFSDDDLTDRIRYWPTCALLAYTAC